MQTLKPNVIVNDGSVKWKATTLRTSLEEEIANRIKGDNELRAYIDAEIANRIKGDNEQKAYTDSKFSELKKYVDENDILNLFPKVGYFGETEVPIFPKFNMALLNNQTYSYWAISDGQGREMLYYQAQSDPYDTVKLYSAYRISTIQKFTYSNSPVCPGYMEEGRDYIIKIYGLASYYMIANVYYNDQSRFHLINTKYSGYAPSWELIKDITEVFTTPTNVTNSYTNPNSKYSGMTKILNGVLYFEDTRTVVKYQLLDDLTTASWPTSDEDYKRLYTGDGTYGGNPNGKQNNRAGSGLYQTIWYIGNTTTDTNVMRSEKFFAPKLFSTFNAINKEVMVERCEDMVDQHANVIYNTKDQRLIFALNARPNFYRNTAKTSKDLNDHLFYFSYKVPPSYFAGTSNATYSNEIANNQYLLTIDLNTGGFNSANEGVGLTRLGATLADNKLTYDEAGGETRLTARDWCQSTAHIYTSSNSDLAFSPNGIPNYFRDMTKKGSLLTRYVESSDASPWAKIIRSILFVNDYLYINSGSKKLGSSVHACVTYRVNSEKTNEHTESAVATLNNTQYKEILDIRHKSFEAGTWWIINGVNSESIYSTFRFTISCHKNGNSVAWYKVVGDINSTELSTKKIVFNSFKEENPGNAAAGQIDRYGAIKYEDTTLPKCPVGTRLKNYRINTFTAYYLPGLNKYAFFVSDVSKTSTDPGRMYFLLVYDCNSATWTEYKTNLAQQHKERSDLSNKRMGIDGSYAYASTNAFIEGNTLYFMVAYRCIGGSTDKLMHKFTFSGNTVTHEANVPLWYEARGVTNFLDPYQPCCLGWSSKKGYYFSRGASYETILDLYCSKDETNSSAPEKANNMWDFYRNSNYYAYRFSCSPAVGLVAFVSDTPLFLGGYFSILEAQEVNLFANCDNYVYIKRDLNDRHAFKIEVTKKYLGGNDRSAFSRILAARLRTNADQVVNENSELIPVNNYK